MNDNSPGKFKIYCKGTAQETIDELVSIFGNRAKNCFIGKKDKTHFICPAQLTQAEAINVKGLKSILLIEDEHGKTIAENPARHILGF